MSLRDVIDNALLMFAIVFLCTLPAIPILAVLLLIKCFFVGW